MGNSHDVLVYREYLISSLLGMASRKLVVSRGLPSDVTLAIQHAFSKRSLVNLIPKDANLASLLISLQVGSFFKL